MFQLPIHLQKLSKYPKHSNKSLNLLQYSYLIYTKLNWRNCFIFGQMFHAIEQKYSILVFCHHLLELKEMHLLIFNNTHPIGHFLIIISQMIATFFPMTSSNLFFFKHHILTSRTISHSSKL